MAEAQKRGRGRPAQFDRAVALQCALKLFWENGFEGTTFDELTAAMGISPSSFYNAFGSKEQLYREAAQSFVLESRKHFQAALLAEGLDTRAAVARFLDVVAERFTLEGLPRGCMVSLSGTHHSRELSPIRDIMSAYRATAEAFLAKRIAAGVETGDMPVDADIEGLAAFGNTLVRGLAVQARDGASREKLLRIIKIAMNAWPAARPPVRRNTHRTRE